MAASSVYAQFVVRGHALSTGERVTRPIANVYTFKRSSALPVLNKVNVMTAFGAAVTANLATVLSVSYLHDFTDVRLLDDPLDPFYTVAGTDNGAVAGDSLPSGNSISWQLKTGIRGRKFRGAKRYGPVAESQTTLDHLSAGAQTAWEAVAALVLAGFTDADLNLWLPYVVSYRLSTFNPTTAIVVASPVTQMTVNNILGTMRRRRQPA